MAKDPLTIDPEATVGAALDIMRTKHVRHLPVVDEAGALMGIVTDRDLRHAAFSSAVQEYLPVRARRLARQIGETLENLRVRDVMTWAVVTTGPETPVLSAALIMFESRVGSLPVIERGRLVGLLTEQDVLKALMIEGKIAEFVGGTCGSRPAQKDVMARAKSGASRSRKAGRPPETRAVAPRVARRMKSARAAFRKDTTIHQAAEGPRVCGASRSPSQEGLSLARIYHFTSRTPIQ